MRTLSGGQRRRVELARILFAAADAGDGTMLLLDEPTNHLDADSITWLRDFLKSFSGGLVIISHDVELLAAVVNKVWFLDAVRGELDIYNMTWGRYLEARSTDEQRRRRERANAEKKAAVLITQAAKLGAKATKAAAAHQMVRRAEALISNLDEVRVSDKVAKIRFPEPAPCGKTPLTAKNLSKSYGSLEIFTGVDLAIDRGSRVVVLGFNGAGKTTLLKLLGGREKPDTGAVEPGHGSKIGYYAQEHETLDPDRTVWENIRSAAPDAGAQELRNLLGTFLFTGEQLEQRAGTLSGGEKTRLALAGLVSSAANVLLLDEPTNNLDPASREQVLDALRRYAGAVVLVTHDPGRRRRPASRSGSSCCRTAAKTTGPPTTWIWSNWPDRRWCSAALLDSRHRWRVRWICSIIGGTPTSDSTASTSHHGLDSGPTRARRRCGRGTGAINSDRQAQRHQQERRQQGECHSQGRPDHRFRARETDRGPAEEVRERAEHQGAGRRHRSVVRLRPSAPGRCRRPAARPRRRHPDEEEVAGDQLAWFSTNGGVTRRDQPDSRSRLFDADLLTRGRLAVEYVGFRCVTITLNRPDIRNAQLPATWEALAHIGSRLPAATRVVIAERRGSVILGGPGPVDVRPGR